MSGSLMERLKAKNDYFKEMVNMIPPQFYFEQGNKQVAPEKYFKNKKGKSVKQGKTLTGGIAPRFYFEQDLTTLFCNFA